MNNYQIVQMINRITDGVNITFEMAVKHLANITNHSVAEIRMMCIKG